MRVNMFRGIYNRLAVSLFVASGGKCLATWLAAAALALAGWSRVANATVINVQLNSTAGVYTGQGALVTSDAHIWNNYLIAVPNPFVDSTGASTSVTVSATQSFLYSPGSTLDTGNDLLDGVRADGSGSFTIGGLSTTTIYNLYLYGWTKDSFGSYGSAFDITSGAGSNTNPQSTSGGAITSGADYTSSSISASSVGKIYVEFTGLVPNSSGQITGTYATNNGSFGYINGFQLATAGTVVPEPASLSLLSFATIGLLARRRRACA